MCGIAGIVSGLPLELVETNHILHAMTDSIAHRGPEAEGFWINKKRNTGFGHRRLKIVDLSDAAAQPLHYADRYTITYNGEIYNYRELRKELISKNYRFFTSSDTEVILAAYDYWKEECLSHFDGMFAFAIWDEDLQELFCARDRFGEKPFYFFTEDHKFLFASEMKAFWAAGIHKRILNSQLLHYITVGLVQNVARPDLTFFEDIFSLQPGHFLKVRVPQFDIKIENYWDIDKETTDLSITENGATEKFSQLLKRSVNRRLRSDVAVGSSLSGGLDSSSIVSLICSLKKEKQVLPELETFSAAFPGFEKDESVYVEKMIQAFPIQNHRVSPNALELSEDFDRLMHHQEEPFQSFSIYAQYKVYQLAQKRGVKVILDGQGADETIAGYHKYYPWYWQELYRRNPVSAARERQATEAFGKKANWGIKNVLAALMPATASRQLENKAIRQCLYHAHIEKEFAVGFDRLAFSRPVVRKLNDLLYFHTCQSGLQELLRYADRNSMAHGREVRMPFLDHELVQFIFSLPGHFKIKNGWTKWILRESMKNQIPESIRLRNDKIGFEPPQVLWMQNKKITERIMEARKKLVRERILKTSVLNTPIKIRNAHEAGNDDFRYLCAAAILPA